VSITWVRVVFAVTGVYDLALGLGFLVIGPQVFEAAGVPPPNHWGYVQFAAALVALFGLMFLAVAARPAANRNLIPYGVLLKLSYVAVVSCHWATGGVPWLFKPFAFIDALMLILFSGRLPGLETAGTVAGYRPGSR
jgi:hypothetical protein